MSEFSGEVENSVPMHSKRLGRELAMEFLFSCELQEEVPGVAKFEEFLETARDEFQMKDNRQARRAEEYARKLYECVTLERETIDEIIIRSLNIKKSVVEQDEREAGIRRILNFGHTIGHGIESSGNMSQLYHGECVALGLIPMCAESIRPRVIGVLQKCGLYNLIGFDWEKITEAAFHDKKADGDCVTVTLVPEIGSFEVKKLRCAEVIEMAKACFEG